MSRTSISACAETAEPEPGGKPPCSHRRTGFAVLRCSPAQASSSSRPSAPVRMTTNTTSRVSAPSCPSDSTHPAPRPASTRSASGNCGVSVAARREPAVAHCFELQHAQGRTTMNRVRGICAALVPGIALSMLGTAAGAVDLRDWGRKYPASERFVVLAQFDNQAVLDKETQLVWQRTPDPNQALQWHYARTSCIAGVFGGRRGWRLPSVHELSSLAEASAPAGTLALPQGHPFQNVPIGRYWTSTRQANQYTNQT